MADNARVAHGRQARVCTSFHGAVRASTSRPPRGSARADPRAIECALPYLAVNDTATVSRGQRTDGPRNANLNDSGFHI